MVRSLVVICITVVLAVGCACAETGPALSLGYFMFADSDLRDTDGLGMTLEVPVPTTPGRGIYASIGYITVSESAFGVKAKLSLIPVMFTVHFKQAEDTSYMGLGVGACRAKAEVSGLLPSGTLRETKTDFMWQVVGGFDFNQTVSMEVKYLNGGEDYNTGYLFSLKARF